MSLLYRHRRGVAWILQVHVSHYLGERQPQRIPCPQQPSLTEQGGAGLPVRGLSVVRSLYPRVEVT